MSARRKSLRFRPHYGGAKAPSPPGFVFHVKSIEPLSRHGTVWAQQLRNYPAPIF